MVFLTFTEHYYYYYNHYLLLEHPIHVCDEFDHLGVGDDPVTVDVEYPEDLDEDLFWRAVCHDVVHDHELCEVHHPVIVLVVHPQHVTLHLLGLRNGQHFVNHLLENCGLHGA